ncbi:hypothetical protein Tco_0520069 [Tanacetum coccineum]
MLNLILDTGLDSILNLNTESTSLVDVPVTTHDEIPPSSATTLPPSPIPLTQHLQQTPVSTPTIIPSTSLQNLPTFGSLFKFENRVKSLEDDLSEFKQTNLFAKAVLSIPSNVDKYLANQMNEAVKAVVQLQPDKLRDEAQAENEDFINKIDDNIKKIVKEQVKVQVKEQVSKILPRIEKSVNEQLEAEVLICSSNEAKTSHAVATNLSELELKKILIDKMENNKSIDRSVQHKTLYKALSIGKYAQAEERIHTVEDLEEPAHQEFNTGFTEDQSVDETTQLPDWFQKPSEPPTPDHDWNKTLPANNGPIQPWISTLARNEDPRESFTKLMDTPLDFSTFVLNRLKVDTLTLELLSGLTFELMKGSCKSLVELEYFLEEVYKVTTDQLDWNNPEGQQYPHDLRKPLPLITNSRSCRVIPFDHFINNDLAYLSGAIIIAITKLTIVEWHNYKHLDWITIRRDDNKLYTFKKGDYKRLHLQDIKDMLLLLVQGKLKNLTIEERLALGVSLRMFTRSIIIKRRVEDLQLGVESYQKKLNLTKPDTYRSNLKRKTAYTAYSNPKGFIYQNKDKKKRLMRIDKLHKFSDGTLNDVWYALDDNLKRIRMEYMPQTVWRNVDKERAGAMIQAIDQ